MKSVLKYPGAKNRLASWICEYIPKHDVYVEPFAGSLAVFFNKQRSHIETVNDIDEEIVNFFRILRDRSDELERAIEFTPFSRSEYKAAYEPSYDDLERARRFAVKCWMGFGCGNLYQNGFKSGQQTNSPNPARAWGELPEIMKLATERLKGVQIENLPALELIKRYDTEDVFIYADPPYLHGTRKNYLYKHEMKDADHEKLLNVLVKHQGKILLSGYDNDMYNDILQGWNKVQKHTRAEGGRARTENGSLLTYVASPIMDALEQSTEFTRKIELTQIAEGGIGIETRVTEIDGVPIMEVIDDERFYDAFDWEPTEGGFAPLKKVAEDTSNHVAAVTGAHKINVLVACGQTCKTVPKIASIYYFNPGTHTEGDGYLYQNRSLSDTFVFPNGRDGKVDSVYVDVDTMEYTGE